MPVRLGAVPRPLRRFVAGARPEDAVRVAAELVAEGRLVALEPVPGRGDDAAAEFAALVAQVRTAGLAASCELTVPVDRLGQTALPSTSPAPACPSSSAVHRPTSTRWRPTCRTPASSSRRGSPDAEERCRNLAGGRVRLLAGRGAAADLAFVRCLNVLMAADGRPAVATADLRLIAVAGERAAWNDRSPDSWEYVMPYGVRTAEQRRLAAAGLGVRVTVPSGRGAVPATARTLVGRA